jgi:hypothetical protein
MLIPIGFFRMTAAGTFLAGVLGVNPDTAIPKESALSFVGKINLRRTQIPPPA